MEMFGRSTRPSRSWQGTGTSFGSALGVTTAAAPTRRHAVGRRPVWRTVATGQVLVLIATAIAFAPTVTHAAGNAGVQFDGTNDYVTFGAAPGLGASTFTVETWFKWTGGGAITTSGTGGLTSVIPLVAKGRGEAEASNLDMNYLLGIQGGVLGADFEEGAGQTTPGLNHPLLGVTTVTPNVWHHAAVTFDGSTMLIYLDGVLDGTLALGAGHLPRSDSIQHAGIGTGLTSTGVAGGFFAGVIDEARVWNVARSAGQISAAMGSEITAQAGLLGAWHLNEGSGTTTANSGSASANGTLTNGPTWVTGFDVTNAGVQFDGTNDYVTFGAAPGLGGSTFTVETWFKWTGGGAITTSGTGGLTSVIPLVAKGRGEAEASNLDMNYLLGIQGGVLGADFEEGAGQTTPGLNHPLLGVTTVTPNVWHHAAVTFDGSTMLIYLDGVLDGTLALGAGHLPRSDSIQHAGIGTGLTSTGVAGGFFAGVIDEARVWNVARSAGQISAAMGSEITAQAGLLGAWHLNEGSGTTTANSGSASANGTLTNGPTWVTGFVAPSLPPSTPTLSSPSNGASGVSTSPTLDVIASDPEGGSLAVSFFGRPLASGQFALIGTQSGVASGAHATMPWPSRGGGQTYQWYATVSDAGLSTTGPTWTFHTNASAGTVLVGVGDIASCTSGGDEQTAAVMAGLDGAIFTTGDNVYQTGTLAEFNSCYGPTWGPFLSRTRPVAGNHDWGNTTPGSLAGYFAYFGANATDAGGKSYYSYDVDANWHVVNLDSECANVTGGCGAGSPQSNWLITDLGANSTKNVIAVWHKPRFSSGATNLVAMQPLVDVLYAAGVDLVFTGHDHIYERFQPIDATGALDPTYGIRHFTIGTGGAEHHAAGTPLSTSAALDDQTYGVTKLVLHPTTYEWQFLPVDGETFTDAGTGTVHAAPVPAQNGLDLGAGGSYVTFGDPAKLDLATFTIETWFKRTGAGVANSTGTGGVATFIPLVTHGGPQAEGSNVDANWLLGINDTGDVLAADFEDTATGLNHPVSGTTVITDNVWHHAAATYDGTTWRLYLDGQLDVTEVENASPRSDSIQHAGLGVMLTSTGAVGNTARFQGVIDETRVWSGARNLNQIRSTINDELTSGTNLVARWAFSEPSGSLVADSIATAANGTISGAGSSRVAGAPFNIPVDTTPPAPPIGLAATPGDSSVSLAWAANVESDLAGYNVYRSTTAPVVLTGPLNGATLVASPAYTDTTAVNGTTYHYVVTAVDDLANESAGSGDAEATPVGPPEQPTGLDLGAGGSYVTFGDPAKLDLATFTIETWFKRTGAGVANSTGTGGVATFIPLVTHGGPQAEGSNVDANWLLGINDTGDVLAADFEDTATGLNHPVSGTTVITDNVWHHAAATYDGTTWRLYLDGQLDVTEVENASPRSDSIQHAGLGVMLTSTGTVGNTARFQGVIDETRVWSGARNLNQLRAGIHQLPVPTTGLVARWPMGEGTGITIDDAVAPDADGSIVGSGTSWPAGAPFDIPIVNAGADQNITLPSNGLLDGFTLDNGTPSPLTTTWTQVSGPDTAAITSPSTASTSVSFAGSGTGDYVFRLTATDGLNTVFDEVSISVVDPGAETNLGLDFDGVNDYVTFGDAPALGLAQFTLETWFRRDGTGATTSTGTGGVTAIPLVTKGALKATGRSST